MDSLQEWLDKYELIVPAAYQRTYGANEYRAHIDDIARHARPSEERYLLFSGSANTRALNGKSTLFEATSAALLEVRPRSLLLNLLDEQRQYLFNDPRPPAAYEVRGPKGMPTLRIDVPTREAVVALQAATDGQIHLFGE